MINAAPKFLSKVSMIIRAPALLSLFLILCSCVNDDPARARATWMGVYTLKSSGNNELISEWHKIKRTKKIPRTLGTRFGVEYKLDGSPLKPLIRYRLVWRYPPNGQINPTTHLKSAYYEHDDFCINGAICRAGYRFDHEWEMVPGTWYAEIWIDDKRVLQKAFEVQDNLPQER